MKDNTLTLYKVEASINGPRGLTPIASSTVAEENGFERAIVVFNQIVHHPYISRELDGNRIAQQKLAKVVDTVIEGDYDHKVVLGEEVPHKAVTTQAWGDNTKLFIVPFDNSGEYLEVRITPKNSNTEEGALEDLYRRAIPVRNQ